MNRILLLPLLFLSATLSAQTLDKIVLPIRPSAITGAFGSSWNTLLAESNDTDQPLNVRCANGDCADVPARNSVLVQASGAATPAFLYVPSDQSGHAYFALRTIARTGDGSRTTMEIPIPRSSDFTSGVFHLQAIPFDAGFRQTLRILDYDGIDGAMVRVRVYTTSADSPAVDTTLVLHTPSTTTVDGMPSAPAFVTIGNLAAAFPALAGAELAFIDVEPVTSGVRIWAFVTSTNNTTQQFNHFTD